MMLCTSEGDDITKKVDADDFNEKPYVDYTKALECINKCNDHNHCPPIEETYLPTRVIDCSDPSKPRLIDTHRRIKGHYCTLSYVWGGEQRQKTTTANINAYIREGINVPLPQTITDAILVTHRLGIRYLWVDALCIIQDSSEDKDNELGIMAHIYRDAYLTISALGAFRADQGFLPDERAPDILPFLFSDTQKSPGLMRLKYIMPRRTPELGFKQINAPIMHNPLDARAWCLQENMLSPRRLIFQPPSVFYKCRSFSRMDISVRNISPVFQRGRNLNGQNASPAKDYILFPVNRNPGATSVEETSESELRRQWQTILSDYSKRRITVPSDKFIALASIVEVLQSLLKDQYIAGLWKRTLMHDLLWEVRPPMGPEAGHHPRPCTYRAPSWSWASVDGQLNWARSDPPSSAASYEAEILTCEATPKIRTYPFGEIVDGWLTLKAKVRPLMLDGSKCTFVEHKGTRSGNRLVNGSSSWYWTPPPGNCFDPPSSVSSSENIGREVAGVLFDCAEGTEQDRQMDFHVAILRAGRNWRNQGDWMQGLLLLRVDEDTEQYKRVGKLDLKYDFIWPDWLDAAPLSTVVLI
ncbi:HET-domain-containing protein [Pholiota conissans]|uniref:HET-domain-containing protein n=1 Tax=Pholiota conissans TaxID=109636 RepID=A0A9P6CTA6_9AGAR|nr:HET-domain-containing protein [Pholiota conissans]